MTKGRQIEPRTIWAVANKVSIIHFEHEEDARSYARKHPPTLGIEVYPIHVMSGGKRTNQTARDIVAHQFRAARRARDKMRHYEVRGLVGKDIIWTERYCALIEEARQTKQILEAGK